MHVHATAGCSYIHVQRGINVHAQLKFTKECMVYVVLIFITSVETQKPHIKQGVHGTCMQYARITPILRNIRAFIKAMSCDF